MRKFMLIAVSVVLTLFLASEARAQHVNYNYTYYTNGNSYALGPATDLQHALPKCPAPAPKKVLQLLSSPEYYVSVEWRNPSSHNNQRL